MNDKSSIYMKRALEIARNGFPAVFPNPMVGAVIVHNDQIIAEGFHKKFGSPHAEVEAIHSVGDKNLIPESTLYVTLEPCCHYGKTPPCTELVISSGIKKVVVSALDPFEQVKGKGIERLREHGIEVVTGIEEEGNRKLNARFFTFHEKRRPYYILKWAETADGFIAQSDFSSKWITSEDSRKLVHQWRTEEMAVMIGTNTAVQDNPYLTARHVAGKNPIRIVIDREQRIPTSFNVFDESAQTLLFNHIEDYEYPAATLIKIDFAGDILKQISDELFRRNTQSVIVEGGAQLLNSFIEKDLWDEARIFVAEDKKFREGIAGPKGIDLKNYIPEQMEQGDKLYRIERE